jgi:hypothetical protein
MPETAGMPTTAGTQATSMTRGTSNQINSIRETCNSKDARVGTPATVIAQARTPTAAEEPETGVPTSREFS